MLSTKQGFIKSFRCSQHSVLQELFLLMPDCASSRFTNIVSLFYRLQSGWIFSCFQARCPLQHWEKRINLSPVRLLFFFFFEWTLTRGLYGTLVCDNTRLCYNMVTCDGWRGRWFFSCVIKYFVLLTKENSKNYASCLSWIDTRHESATSDAFQTRQRFTLWNSSSSAQ